MKTKSLGFIGGGRITRIFLQAFANKKAIFDSISVFDTNPSDCTIDTQCHFGHQSRIQSGKFCFRHVGNSKIVYSVNA